MAAFLLAAAMPSHAQTRSRAPRIDATELRCMANAARQYHQASDPVSLQAFVDLLAAIRLTEGGQVGRITWNHNGTYDIGPMQINSSHLAQLQRYGISYQALLLNPCQNIMVAAWILHSNLASSRSLWTSIGDYNSHTTAYNRQYQQRIWQRLQALWSAHATRGVLSQGSGAVASAQ